MQIDNEILSLLKNYLKGTISDDEQQRLDNWAVEHASNQALLDSLNDPAILKQELQDMHLLFQSQDERWSKIHLAIQEIEVPSPVHRIHFLKTAWFRYAAAILLVLGAGTYFWMTNKKSGQELPEVNKPFQAHVVPGKDGAILTLGDGRQVVLDSLENGVVAKQNGTQVVLDNGSITYGQAKDESATVIYNIMTTPKGRQFKLILPDGSKVWLNAASSIKYPTAFTGTERVVEINGEAYFEVAKNKNRPFKVKVNDATFIEVLGTHFNVNSYQNEEAVKTTLLEGSVRVNAFKHIQTIKPGQQVQTYSNETIKVVNDLDVNQVIAWKNGYFDFNNVNLPVMMRQLERWYDITVSYEGKIPDVVFEGQMDRNVQLSDLIRFLTVFKIKTSLQGRTLTISAT